MLGIIGICYWIDMLQLDIYYITNAAVNQYVI